MKDHEGKEDGPVFTGEERINVSNREDRRWWSEYLGVSESLLLRLVVRSGTKASDVQDEIRRQKKKVKGDPAGGATL